MIRVALTEAQRVEIRDWVHAPGVTPRVRDRLIDVVENAGIPATSPPLNRNSMWRLAPLRKREAGPGAFAVQRSRSRNASSLPVTPFGDRPGKLQINAGLRVEKFNRANI